MFTKQPAVRSRAQHPVAGPGSRLAAADGLGGRAPAGDSGSRVTRGKPPGFTLVELMISIVIGTLVLGAVSQIMFFSGRSLAGLFNYTDLDFYSRKALDVMSKEIRQASSVKEALTNSITLIDFDGGELEYKWDSGKKQLTREKDGVTTTLLADCDFLAFSVYQRNPEAGTYDQYPVAIAGTAKLVQVRWVCSRKVLGVQKTTESVQSAKFVIRKE